MHLLNCIIANTARANQPDSSRIGWSIAGRQIGWLQLKSDRVDQCGYRGPASLHNKMRSLSVKRIPRGIQIDQPLQWIGHLKKRPIAVMSYAPENVIRPRVQVNDLPCRPQHLPVCRPQYDTAPSGDYPWAQCCTAFCAKFSKHTLLYRPKAIFALALKIVPYGTAQCQLNLNVCVNKRCVEFSR
jgi:hypothetical protein